MSGAHAQDIDAVANYLKKQAAVPVWLVGTSMGTFSAAGGAIGAKSVDGLVPTSTITRAKPEWKIAGSHPNGVASMALPRGHRADAHLSQKKDGCDDHAGGGRAEAHQPADGGAQEGDHLAGRRHPAESDPCEAKSQHGFLGIEGRPSARSRIS